MNQLNEAQVIKKLLGNEQDIRRIALAMRHDETLPRTVLARLGHRPTDLQLAETWSQLLDSMLSNTNYGNLSTSGKFDMYMTRLYMNGQADYEKLHGEVADTLGSWLALSRQRWNQQDLTNFSETYIKSEKIQVGDPVLRPEDQDFNKFPSTKALIRAMSNDRYQGVLRRLKDAERIKKMKKNARSVVIMDDDRYWSAVLLNYGACYVFNFEIGIAANFCTGSSSGESWFQRYADDSMIVAFIDKKNVHDNDGKWQFHAASNQLKNANQLAGGDRRFAQLFPGMMQRIAHAIESHAVEIKQQSRDSYLAGELPRLPNGYDAVQEVQLIARTFPLSWASEAPETDKTKNNPQSDQPMAATAGPREPNIAVLGADGNELGRLYVDPDLSTVDKRDTINRWLEDNGHADINWIARLIDSMDESAPRRRSALLTGIGQAGK
jgi:hypothetical protein